MTALRARWSGLGIVTRRLVLFALVNGAVINLAVPLLTADATGWQYTVALIGRVAFNDSWALMNHALQYLHVPQLREMFSDKPLYAVIFFDQHVKFLYPPTSLLLLEPLRMLYRGAFIPDGTLNFISWIGVLVGILAVVRILFLGMRRYGLALPTTAAAEKSILFLLAAWFTITFFPLTKAFVVGQIQVWIDLAFLGLVLAWMEDEKSVAGICGGFICIIKPQLALLLLWGVLRKQWRFAATFAVTVAVLLLLSIAAYGWANNADYLRVLSAISRYGESCYANQCVNGLLNRLLFNGYNLVWDEHHYPPYNPIVFYGTAVTSALLVLSALLYRRREHEHAPLIDLFVAVLSFTMASPIAWEHHYGVTLPMFAVLLPATLAAPKLRRSGGTLLAVSFVLIANYFAILNRTSETYFNIVQSSLFLGAALLLFHLYRLRRLAPT